MILAKAGDKLAVEVSARRLNSPLDSLVKVTDTAGKVIALNDDNIVKDKYLHIDSTGLSTHHADSYLLTELPKAGTYYVHISDTQNQGSEAHGYRLRISKPQPDFDLRVTPSSLSIRAGSFYPVRVDILRKDGFDGEIEITAKDAETGFKVAGNKIAAGTSSITMTLQAPYGKKEKIVALELIGKSKVGEKSITRPVVPADNVMQAFLYRHLVPAKEMAVLVYKYGGQLAGLKLAGDGPVKIIPGKSTPIKFTAPGKRKFTIVELDIYHGPAGLTVEKIENAEGTLQFSLKADKETLDNTFTGNVIIEAISEYTPKQKKGKPKPKKRKSSQGVLPAIPIEFVKQI
jgi:hypothetical protein